MSKTTKSDLKRIALVTIGAFINAVALKIFVQPNGLLSGGFSGLSILFSRIFSDFLSIKISFGVFNIILNVLPTLLVLKYVGKKFTLFSLINIILVSIFVDLIPPFYLTDDMFLICIFGGIMAGFANLLSLIAEASSGGTDFIAIYFSSRYNRSFWNYVLVFNAIMLFLSGLIYGFELSLYSIIYQFTATQVINTFHKRYKLLTLFIVTEKSEELSCAIMEKIRRGITKIDGEGMYGKKTKSMLYLVINENELNLILGIVQSIDDKAFINEVRSHRVIGNFYQKPFD